MSIRPLDEYEHWINTAAIDPDAADRVEGALCRARENRRRYTDVADKLGVPWTLLAALHELEAGGDLDCHPANGDPLADGKTTHVPEGLPRHVEGELTYEKCAPEEYAELRKPEGEWTLAWMCRAAEGFNGFGSWFKGRRSPYIVAATTLAQSGKYTSDHHYEPGAQSSQVGTLALWIAMREAGIDVP